MTVFVFADYINTTLAAAATNTDTTLTLASSTNLPTLATGQIMALTLNDAATGLVYEIVYVTDISGTTLTVERAQEGTTAQNWSSGDYAFSGPTAGQQAAAGQIPQIQSGIFNYADDTGAVNALAVTLSPAPASLAALVGAPIHVKVANTNTGASTLDVNGLGAVAIQQFGTALIGNQLVASTIATFIYDGTVFECLSVTDVLQEGRLLNIQVFSTAGSSTYTPTAGTQKAKVTAMGGGGGSAGTNTTTSTEAAVVSGGNSGSWGIGIYSVSGPVTVTVGAGGTAGAAGGGAGGSGGTSSFGTFLTAPGGQGGVASTTLVPPYVVGPLAPANVASGGNIVNVMEVAGGNGEAPTAAGTLGGEPGVGLFGSSYGAGAVGRSIGPSAPAYAGFAGNSGIVIVEEFS